MSVSAFDLNTRAILAALLDGKGEAYDSGSGSASYAECEAVAMAIAACRDVFDQVASASDPRRMSDPFLARWERIFGIASNADVTARRAEVAFRFSLFGLSSTPGNTETVVNHACSDAVPSVTRYTSANASVHTLVSTVIPGGIDTSADTLRVWSSGISHLTVALTPPAWMSTAERDKLGGRLARYLDDFLPAWCTWCWSTASYGIPINSGESIGVTRFA